MHHNVIWNVQGGIMVKGYNHNIYNNTSFDNGSKNDIIIMIDQGVMKVQLLLIMHQIKLLV